MNVVEEETVMVPKAGLLSGTFCLRLRFLVLVLGAPGLKLGLAGFWAVDF